MNLELGLEQAPADKPYSVSFIMEAARDWINKLRPAWVEGEVSDLTKARSGHWYFTLKDKSSAMQCVVWADAARGMRSQPEDGVKVYARGYLTVFPRRGQLQFTVRQILPTSEGGFHAIRLEKARKALEKDGLLDPARKRPLPPFPSCIGVVTSAVSSPAASMTAAASAAICAIE